MGKSVQKHIYKVARKLFESGVTHDTFVQKAGKVEKPIPVHDPDGDLVSWFVGITVSDRLAGFMQFGTDASLMRYSTFQRHTSSLEGCPPASAWLDPKYIKKRARTRASRGDVLSRPYLTYDRNLSRLVWVVNVKSKRGKVKTIYVAGEYVYLPERFKISRSET
jgi:hypothetical protein